LPVLLDRSDAARVQLGVASAGAPVLIGAQRVEGFSARNSLALVDGGGTPATFMTSTTLCRSGNTCRWPWLADQTWNYGARRGPAGGYSPGEGPSAVDLGPVLGRAFPMICYEAIFPGYIRRFDTRPDWIVHVTNDAWFGTFSGPWQHLAIARLRAAEQGLPVLRAANTGCPPLSTAGERAGRAPPRGGGLSRRAAATCHSRRRSMLEWAMRRS
jgi:apolipoprotein N-acyltransferase